MPRSHRILAILFSLWFSQSLIAATAPRDGDFTFINAAQQPNGTVLTPDGFFVAQCEVEPLYPQTGPGTCEAKGDGFGLYVDRATGRFLDKAIFSVRVAAGGSFTVTDADIGQVKNDPPTPLTDIYFAGFVNGTQVCETLPVSSTGAQDLDLPIDYSPCADKVINEFRVYFGLDVHADRLYFSTNIAKFTVKNASTTKEPPADGSQPPSTIYSVGGNVSGLKGSVTLQNNGGDDQTLSADGSYSFGNLADGTRYQVTVLTQPTEQICTVSNGSGSVKGADVTNVDVSCVDNTYTLGGLLSGLVAGDTVVLQNNAGDDLTLSANGAFTFTTPVAVGDAYAVTVLSQPTAPSETCTVTNGSGTMPSGGVTDIKVTCTLNTFTVSGDLNGLAAGSSVELQINGANSRTLNADGNLAFAPLADGTTYTVSVATQPAGQTCRVSNGSGTLAGGTVTNVRVSCQTPLGSSTINADRTLLITDGQASVIVTVRDAAGNPRAGTTVTLVVDNASVDASAVSIATSPTVTDANGEARFLVNSSVAQTVQFKASFNPDLFITVRWTDDIAAIPTLSAPALGLLGALVIALGSWQRRRRLLH